MDIVIIIGTGLIVFAALGLMVPYLLPDRGEKRTKSIIEQIALGADDEDDPLMDQNDAAAHFKEEATGLTRFLLEIPGAAKLYSRLLKAGHAHRIQSVIWLLIGLFVAIFVILFIPLGFFAAIPAAIGAYLIPRWWFGREITKRNKEFIKLFPEAIDMIVRSVKSGHPLNTALRMIADNMEDPIRTEFRQLVNEIAYGRPLVEALRRLGKRVDEQDVHFFVVVLAVQQETGGNLAEILKNLSNVIRGRKRLQQKIQAMTSEGRATLAILGSLPILVYLAIQFTSPEYMLPLYNTLPGNVILGGAITLIVIAVVVIHKMIEIDI